MVVVIVGTALLSAAWLGFGIFEKQRARKEAPQQTTAKVGSSATHEIKATLMPTRATDAQGKPIPEDELKRNRQYNLGRTLGQCLTQGCQVFAAIVTEIGDPEKTAEEPDDWTIFYRKITLNIDQWHWGEPNQLGPSLQIMHAAKPLVFKSGAGPWSVWEGVDLKVNEKVLVALWDAHARKNRSDPIAVVISDDALAAKTHETVNLHTRLTQFPDQIEQATDLLKLDREHILTGYIMAYLTGAGVTRNVNRGALVLSGLLPLRSLPIRLRHEAARGLTSDLDRLSAETRHAVVESLIATATDNDLNQAVPALSSLVWLTDFKQLDLKPLVRTERRRKLIANYRAMLAAGSMDKGHEPFESQLGLKPSR